mmetsp:Transcript_5155/g.8903  ORF Transcript_5155/g.8903 Transcript_5155/m.8903 type:complete len:124 (+) Transcript_5155:1177-1548(+)|eukprot:CAMPEP_0196655294 /NCGR_PEP_ID=MMETSP1086-20130531/5054_1 /TAXON_ID=77921 /ORGANISM="Cyanoptyche  gloeocystis , Strain SAG4.97" /LENGTH=123 /DNA_ID=CAMNT_0041987529 /DNA_START=974 /DNA_END=1345 /DNA_ORIENTATION=+
MGTDDPDISLHKYLSTWEEIHGFTGLADVIRQQTPNFKVAAQLSKLVPSDVLAPFALMCGTCFARKQLKSTGDHKPYHTAEAEPISGCTSVARMSRCTENPDRLRMMLGIDVKAAGDDEEDII